MRFNPSLLFLTASVAVYASPISITKRAVKCTAVDDDGTPLVSSNPEEDGFATCTYQGAGACLYFGADGSFSAGSSQCPA
ncbi:hypothetical protein C8J57DRAFT_1295487, partial [Mycena rebaudengoi]